MIHLFVSTISPLLLLLLQQLCCAHLILTNNVITFIFFSNRYKFDLVARRKKRPQQSIYVTKNARTQTPEAEIQLQRQIYLRTY